MVVRHNSMAEPSTANVPEKIRTTMEALEEMAAALRM
jgi:hypothetical protein